MVCGMQCYWLVTRLHGHTSPILYHFILARLYKAQMLCEWWAVRSKFSLDLIYIMAGAMRTGVQPALLRLG